MSLPTHNALKAKMSLCSILLLLIVCKVAAVSQWEISSLRNLYSSTNGSHWKWDGNGAIWNFSLNAAGQYASNACLWQGICCYSQMNLAAACSEVALFANLTKGDNEIAGIVLNEMALEGQVPSLIANITSLVYLKMNGNELSGSLPYSLSKLQLLKYIDFSDNQFTLPLSLFDLTSLEHLELQHNSLTGTIPINVRPMTSLTYLDISNNMLTGSISSLTSNANLQYLSLSNNYIEGTIPVNIQNMTLLNYLDMSNNLLAGSIASMSPNVNLQYLSLSNNNFHGYIAGNMELLKNLVVLSLDDNLLSGPLPASVTSLLDLELISISNNKFDGPFPNAMCELPSLSYLSISSNQITGTLDCPSPIIWPRLEVLNIAQNPIGGTIPSYIFNLPAISTIYMIENSFTGEMASTCNLANTKLTTIYMSALTAQQSAGLALFSTVYFIKGIVPTCLFQFSNLETLVLSNNGLSGGLPAVHLPASLKTLILSDNRLTGTIPIAFQVHEFELLQLSYNRLSGNLQYMSNFFDVASNASLSLQSNRLSGYLPADFHDAVSIDVVSFNHFNCEGNGFPLNDPGAQTTQCGTSNYSSALYVWYAVWGAAILCALAIMAMLMSRFKHIITLSIPDFNMSTDRFSAKTLVVSIFTDQLDMGASSEALRSTRHFMGILSSFQFISILSSCFILSVMLPIDLCMRYRSHSSSKHSALTFANAYIPTAAYLYGSDMAIIQCTCVMLLMIIVSMLDMFVIPFHDEKRNNEKITPHCFTRLAVLGVIIMLDIVLMLAINIAYCDITLSFSSTAVATGFMDVLVVAGKMIWNSWLLPLLIVKSAHICSGDDGSIISGRYDVLVIGFLAILNTILIPLLANAMWDPYCLGAFLYSPPVISVDSIFIASNVTELNPALEPIVEISTNLPYLFIYGYQCSFTVFTNYWPVYILMFLYLGTVSPLICWFLMRAQESSEAKTRRIAAVAVDFVGYRIMKSAKDSVPESLSDNSNNKNNNNSSLAKCFANGTNGESCVLISGVTIAAVMACNLTALVTFGAANPPLAFLICIAICVESFQWKFLIRRYLKACLELSSLEQRRQLIDQLESNLAGLQDILTHLKFWILIAMGLVFAVVVHDMGGDSAANLPIIFWLPVIMVLCPVFIFFISNVMTGQMKPMDESQTNSHAASVEVVNKMFDHESLGGEL